MLAVLAPAGPVAAAQAIDPAVLGTTGPTAAGSCWEIKQARPGAVDGAYWLLTPTMSEPQQFYCDMTTDGGGWVLIGKGRDAWVNDTDGKGSAAALLTPGTAPMSATTVQLGSRQVDQLLNGTRPDALADGVRLRRARDTAGTAWQEVRAKYTNRSRWAWTFGAEWPLTGFSFDGVSGTGGTSPSFGLNDAYNRVVNTTTVAKGYRVGFAYGNSVTGTSDPASYLYSATNGAGGAIPYTQVFLRPKVLSTDAGFSAVADTGVAATTLPNGLRSTALASPWGVSGTAGSTTEEGNVEVQAFTQSGNRMYVGGNFRYVQQDSAGTGRVEQPFLAAFDITTGEWVSSFRPVLNEQVRALATLPSGVVVAGGSFTQANGQPASAVVALDPTTGATSTTWKVGIENRVTGVALRVNSIDVSAPYVYIGGNVSHFTGSTSTTARYMRMLGRVSSTDGLPSTGWNPNLNGAVKDVDASTDGTRVYASGYFTTANGVAAKNAAAIMNTAGAPLATPAWSPVWSSSKSYQQAIEEVGSKLWVGGSEHSLFQFDPTTFARTGGNISKSHGDIQTITSDRGVVYAGCHCDQFDYSNAFTWPTLSAGWTQADAMGWFAAYDATTGARLPSFVPTFNMRLNQGIWALKADTTGTMWAGGDVASVRTNAQQARWSGGFARFPLADSTAPTTPSGLTITSQDATTVTLAWTGSTDAGGGVRYQVLRDDRTVLSTTANTRTLTVPKGGSNRFFVRAIDGVGNVSASTPVVVAAP
jgi:hypothetical protein